MLSRINRERQVRVAPVRANPGAVEPDSCRYVAKRPEFLLFDDIDQRSSRVRLCRRMFADSGFYSELSVAWPASRFGGGSGDILSQSGNRQQDHHESCFHMASFEKQGSRIV